ncbi:MAG: hypothetical protein OSA97_12835, partial [Nevskia sp.]|nr:hypothetical protein [Nevskia sp.]
KVRLKTVEPQSPVGTDFRHGLTVLCDIGARIDGLQSPSHSFNAPDFSTLSPGSRDVRTTARAAGARAEHNSIQHEPGMSPKVEGARRSFDGRHGQGSQTSGRR